MAQKIACYVTTARRLKNYYLSFLVRELLFIIAVHSLFLVRELLFIIAVHIRIKMD